MPANVYSDSEIKDLYKYAKDKQYQIKILAQLCLCTTTDIKRTLGLPISSSTRRRKPNKALIDLPVKAIVKAYSKGASINALAKKYGVHSLTIKQRIDGYNANPI